MLNKRLPEVLSLEFERMHVFKNVCEINTPGVLS